MLLLLMLSGVSFGGEDVPWPASMQEALRYDDLSGLWVSIHIENPAVSYDIRVERTGLEYCPHIVSVAEIDQMTGAITAHGSRVNCRDLDSQAKLLLYDAAGEPVKIMEMVGVTKVADQFSLGRQYLGITIYDAQDKQRIFMDLFYKYHR